MPKIYTNKNGQKKDIGGPIQKPIYEQKRTQILTRIKDSISINSIDFFFSLSSTAKNPPFNQIFKIKLKFHFFLNF